LLCLGLGLGLGLGGAWLLGQRIGRNTSTLDAHPPGMLTAANSNVELWSHERLRTEIFAARRAAVVHIDTSREELGREFYFGSANRMPVGLGSGIVWDREGHVVTNRHLLAGVNAAVVRLADGSEWRASLIGAHAASDVAVLKIDAPVQRLEPLLLGSSAGLLVGQTVLAIGNPFGLDWTLTVGIVSGLDRLVESSDGLILEGLIQTDAAINPGNSGGPLLDSAGLLVGLNTAVGESQGGGQGFGFAVPVDTLRSIVPQILERGSTPRAGLGVRLLEDRSTRALGLRGALIAVVLEGSPAARAGLEPVRLASDGRLLPGDLIVAVADQPIENNQDLARALAGRQVGEAVPLRLERAGQTRTTTVVLSDTLPLAPTQAPAPAVPAKDDR
jgi:S1-C subfamily serine protease